MLFKLINSYCTLVHSKNFPHVHSGIIKFSSFVFINLACIVSFSNFIRHYSYNLTTGRVKASIIEKRHIRKKNLKSYNQTSDNNQARGKLLNAQAAGVAVKVREHCTNDGDGHLFALAHS